MPTRECSFGAYPFTLSYDLEKGEGMLMCYELPILRLSNAARLGEGPFWLALVPGPGGYSAINDFPNNRITQFSTPEACVIAWMHYRKIPVPKHMSFDYEGK